MTRIILQNRNGKINYELKAKIRNILENACKQNELNQMIFEQLLK